VLRMEPAGRRSACSAVADVLAACAAAAASVDDPAAPGLAGAAAAAEALLAHAIVLSDRVEARRGSAGATSSVPMPAPGEPRFASWLSAPVRMLAEQWARLDFAAFQRVPVEELLRAGFDDPRYKHSADAVRACIDRFNAESLWAASEVMAAPSPRARAATYMRLLAVAVWLRRLRDYFGLSAILTGLRSGPIKRLHLTHAALPADAAELEKDLSKTVSEALFFTRYLRALAATPPGAAATPYLAPHTQLLLLTESAMDSAFPTNWNLGHAYKGRALYEVAAPLAELKEGTFTAERDGDACRPVFAVCGLIEAALRGHTFYFDEDAGAARARLLRQSTEAEPDLPPPPLSEPDIGDDEEVGQWEQGEEL